MNHKYRHQCPCLSLPLASAFIGLVLTAKPLHASVTTVNDSNTTESTFSPTTGDLLETSVASSSHSGWSTNNSANTIALTDGVYGSIYTGGTVVVDGAWDQGGTPISTYDLDITSNTLGYDLTSIVSIAGWNGAGLGNQQFTVEVSTVGSPSFTLLATGNNQLLGASNGGNTVVTVQDDTTPGAVIASGVDAVRFTSLGTVGANGWAVFREFDVIGIPTSGGPDETAPQILALVPANSAGGVARGDNLVATFDEAIAIGTGNISIKDLDTPSQDAIAVDNAQVMVAGAVLTIDPSSDLAPNTNYSVQIDATAIDDTAGNSFAGITDDTTWNFTTAPVDSTAPTVSTLSPVDNTTGVPAGSDLVVTFDEAIAISSGDITIKDLDTPSQTVIPVADSQVSVSGAVLTIDPGSNLAASTNYAIQIAATAITDLADNPFAGITDDTTWNFATATPPAEEFSTTQFTYAGDVSASDLLHGLTPVTTGWNVTNEASPLELTDGIHGVGFGEVPSDRVQGGWTTVGATAEYNLGLSPSGAGWDITSIQSIADWANVGFGNQAWTLEVKPVGGSYTTLDTVDYQPLGAGGGTTKVNLTDPSGVLATGVEFVKITANEVNGGTNAGAFVWRELDVFGMPSNDETPPQIATLDPVNGTSGVAPGRTLVATFDENIVLGVGNITIKDLDTPSQTVVSIGDPQISVSGANLTINPTSDLAINTSYAIQIDATAVDDASGNSFLGITNDNTWAFTTGEPDVTPPTINSLSPPNTTSQVALASNLVVTFDENIAIGAGNITIKDLDTPSQTVIPIGDAQVSISGSVLTINPASNLAATTNYAVQIDGTAITDLAGNPFIGITDDTTWSFVTASEPLRIMCLGDSITVGYTDNPSWANHPFMFGYRSGLYTRLTNAGYNFQFVGTSTEPWTGISGDPTNGGTYTPALDLRDFGQDDHRGYGGAGIWNNVNSWIDADNPDVILLLIGINGIGSGSPAALNTLVNNIVTHAPDVHLIVAQITPRSTFNQNLFDYNLYIRDTLLPTYIGNGSKISTVDLYSFFLDDPSTYTTIPSTTGAITPGVLSNNINHPDNPRYDLMAQEWFEGIEALGLGPNGFTSWISDPVFGLDPADQDFDDDPDGDNLANGIEAWLGTNPGQFNAGLTGLATDGTVTTFSHSQNENPPSDLSGSYEWSPNLINWYSSDGADGPVSGPTVTAAPITVGATTNVTATASEPLERLFLRIAVTQN